MHENPSCIKLSNILRAGIHFICIDASMIFFKYLYPIELHSENMSIPT